MLSLWWVFLCWYLIIYCSFQLQLVANFVVFSRTSSLVRACSRWNSQWTQNTTPGALWLLLRTSPTTISSLSRWLGWSLMNRLQVESCPAGGGVQVPQRPRLLRGAEGSDEQAPRPERGDSQAAGTPCPQSSRWWTCWAMARSGTYYGASLQWYQDQCRRAWWGRWPVVIILNLQLRTKFAKILCTCPHWRRHN